MTSMKHWIGLKVGLFLYYLLTSFYRPNELQRNGFTTYQRSRRDVTSYLLENSIDFMKTILVSKNMTMRNYFVSFHQ